MDLGFNRPFHHWQDALLLPSATATTIAQALDKRVFTYFGLPEVIHSDRGTQFESEIFTELCSLWRMDKTRTSPYHPQSNGIVERGKRTLGDALRCLLLEQNRRQKDWDELLHHIMRSFRATPNSTTGETANFMMMGRECTLPDTLLYGNEVEPPMSSTDYVALLQSRMQKAHDLLRTQQHTGPIGETEDLLYKVGDLVLVDSRQRRKRVSPKLQAQFVGPFRVKGLL